MFRGFPPEALKFFRDLKRNNNRDWFQPRKEIFDTKVKAPMIELVEAINAEFEKFAPQYVTDPRKAVYRIYRDLRFSSDKSPYKTHLAASFSRHTVAQPGSGGHAASAGYFFSIGAKEVGIAGGVYDPAPHQLLAVRQWIAENHEAFRKLLKAPKKLMGDLHGEPLTRVPKGFAADHPAADLLKMKRWVFWTTLNAKVATTPKIVPELVKRFKILLPVLEELNKPLATKKRAAIFE